MENINGKNMLKKINDWLFKFSLAIFGALAMLVPATALADIQSGLNDIGNAYGSTSPGGVRDFRTLIQYIIRIALYVAGAIAVLFLIIGGYMYLTSAGNEEQAEKGRKTVTNSLIGIVIIILSYVIVNVITNLVTRGV